MKMNMRKEIQARISFRVNGIICLLCFLLFQNSTVWGAFGVNVFQRDEALSETDQSKPRIYIQNTGTDPISSMYYYYYIQNENNKTPILQIYYTPNETATLEQVCGSIYRVKYTLTNHTINPGEIFSSSSGNVVGLRYNDWTTWDKTNDFSNNRSNTFIENQNIAVYVNGSKIYGNEPSCSGIQAPSSLNLSVISAEEIDLSWVDNSSDESEFSIERSTDGTNFAEITTVSANVTLYQNTGLTANTTYYYRVRAHNSSGYSTYSNTVSASTQQAVPAAPTNLVASAVTTQEIDISWTDNSTNESEFCIESSTDGISFTQITTVGTNVTSFHNTGLTANITYYYRVRAHNSSGYSTYSNTVSALTQTTIPAAPTSLTASVISISEIDITWTDNSTNENEFCIERSTDGINFTQITNVGANITSFHNTGLTASTTYYYKVRAHNSEGYSSYSNTISGMTQQTAPVAPTNLSASAVSTQQINITWTDNSNNETGFSIEQSTNGTTFSEIATVGANVTRYQNTGLNANTQYYFRVRAFNSLNSSYSNTVSATTQQILIASPTNLVASMISTLQINLSWMDNSNNETGFSIERSTDGTNFSVLTTVGANVTAYQNTGLNNNTTYFYRVRAYNSGNNSSYSNTASATTKLLEIAYPTNLTALAVSAQQINLSWTDNSSVETGYSIERSTDGGANYSVLTTVGASVTSYQNTGLTAGTTYYYRVRAYNSTINSPYSNVAYTATQQTVLAAPTNLTALPASTQQINLSWVDNSTVESGFRIERSTDGTNFSEISTVGANVTTYQSTGLSVNTKYYYRVRAYNSGNSSYSNIASTSTLASINAPSNASITVISAQQLNVTWTDNSNNENGFKIERSTDGVNFVEVTTVAANNTSWQNTGLDANTKYYYKVRAFNTGFSSYSNIANGTTLQSLPVPPSNLTATVVFSQTIDLSWSDNSTNETGFRIERSTDGNTYSEIGSVAANITIFENSGLAADTKYYYRVRAYNTVNSAYSNIASATTQKSGPASPTNLVTTAVSIHEIDLSWTDNSTVENGFKIERSVDNVNFSEIAKTGADITSYQDKGLVSSTKYYYRVRAYNFSNSDASNTVSATTLQSVPVTPTNLTAYTVNSQEIDLSWMDNSTDEMGFSIERSTDGINFTEITTVGSNVNTYHNTGLSPNTQYYYKIRAYNAVKSAYSNRASATTQMPGPSSPSNLTAIPISSQQINLSWTDNSSDETGFKIERSTDNVNFTLNATVGENINTYQNTDLNENTQYYYRVRAFNIANSGYSNTVSVTTPQTIPAAPTSLSAGSIKHAQEIELTWIDNSNNESGFLVERSTDGTNFSQIAALSSNVTSYRNSGLTASVYYYRVKAYNSGGFSLSNNLTVTTALTGPAAPTNLAASAVSLQQINLSWTDNSGSETAYKIERSADGIVFVEIASVDANVTAYQNTGLTGNTRYYYRVRAYSNGFDYSAYTNISSATTQAAPSAPTALTATVIYSQEIDLSWTDNSTDESGFIIERSVDNINYSEIATVGENVTVYKNSELTVNTQYYYRVRAYNSLNSAYSNTASATTTQPGPAAPTSCSAIATSPNQIDIFWSDNTSNESGYLVEQSMDGFNFVQIASLDTNITAYSNTGLTENKQYWYRVRGYNAYGNSAYSNISSATTPFLKPDAPTNLTATVVSTQKVDLFWTDNSNNEKGYKIERASNASEFVEIADLEQDIHSYHDDGLLAGNTYIYRVRAYNDGGNSDYSNQVTTTTDMPNSGTGPLQSLYSYSIFSTERSIITDNAVYSGGTVGSNGEVYLGNHAVVYGNVVSGSDITLTSQSAVNGDAFAAGTVYIPEDASVSGSINNGTPMEYLAIPIKQITTSDVINDVVPNQPLTLNPGLYGQLIVESNATVTLLPGAYTFDSLILKTGAHVVFNVLPTQKINIDIQKQFEIGNGSSMQFSGYSYAPSVQIYTNDNDGISTGENSVVKGCIYAPYSMISIKSNTQCEGAFYAKIVKVESNTEISSALMDPEGDPDHDGISNYTEVFETYTDPNDGNSFKRIAIPYPSKVDNSSNVTVTYNMSRYYSDYSDVPKISVEYKANSLTKPTISPALYVGNKPYRVQDSSSIVNPSLPGFDPVGRYIMFPSHEMTQHAKMIITLNTSGEPIDPQVYNSAVYNTDNGWQLNDLAKIVTPFSEPVEPLDTGDESEGMQMFTATTTAQNLSDDQSNPENSLVYADIDYPISSIILIRKKIKATAYLGEGVIYSNGDNANFKSDIVLNYWNSQTVSGTINVTYMDYVDPSNPVEKTKPLYLNKYMGHLICNGTITSQGRIEVTKIETTISDPAEKYKMGFDIGCDYVVEKGECLKMYLHTSAENFRKYPKMGYLMQKVTDFTMESMDMDGEGRIRKLYPSVDNAPSIYQYEYYLKDYLGSTRMVMNDQDEISEAVSYYPYGKMYPISMTSTTPEKIVRQKFTGKELDQGDEPLSEFEFDINVSDVQFAVGQDMSAEFRATYTINNISCEKRYPMTIDLAGRKCYFKKCETFPSDAAITKLVISVRDYNASSSSSDEIKTYNYVENVYNTYSGKKTRIHLDKKRSDILKEQYDHNFYVASMTDATNLGAGSDLYYFGARYYDPDLGRWTSTDPSNEFFDLYSYVGGNPINKTDPDGKSTELNGNTIWRARNDGDNGIYSAPIGIGKLIGYSPTPGEFTKAIGGTFLFGRDATPLVNEMASITLQHFFLNPIGWALLANYSRTNQLLDVKQIYGANNAVLLNGYYVRGESVGNYLFGKNAVNAGIPWDVAIRFAGLYHINSNPTTSSMSDYQTPYFGEPEGWQIDAGYHNKY